MAKFDPNKPHGTISGDGSPNPIVYEQGGVHFCADGTPWVAQPDKEVEDVEKRIAVAVAEALAKAKK
jgi:hypothetical protein